MRLDDVLQNIKYLKDEQTFWNVAQRKAMDEPAVIKKLFQVLNDMNKAVQTLDAIKSHGIKKSELKRGTNLNIELHQSYERIKTQLPLRRLSSKGNPVLYTIDAASQVTQCGDMDLDKFRTIVADTPTAIQAVQYEFTESTQAATYLQKFTLASFIAQLYNHFIVDPDMRLPKEPELISWDPAVPAYRVLDSSVLKEGPTPAWDEWLSRMDFPETFKAYVWSTLEPRNIGRQALWIKGPGSDGKSTAINAIATFLGRQHVMAIGAGSYAKDFFFGDAYGKRMAVYMDCKNPGVIRYERIKSLLGRDTVNINNKYERAFSAMIYAKLFVLANDFPKINITDNSEVSRLLLCTIESYKDKFGDPNFQFNLEDEMGAFLHKCRISYENECPRHGNLKTPEKMWNLIQSRCQAKDSEIIEMFINEHLEFAPHLRTSKLHLHNNVLEYMSKWRVKDNTTFTESDFGKILESKGVSQAIDKKSRINLYHGVDYTKDSPYRYTK